MDPISENQLVLLQAGNDLLDLKFNTLKRIYNGLRENGLFKFTLPVDRKGRTSLPGARSAEEDEGKRCGTQHRTYRKVKSVTK